MPVASILSQRAPHRNFQRRREFLLQQSALVLLVTKLQWFYCTVPVHSTLVHERRAARCSIKRAVDSTRLQIPRPSVRTSAVCVWFSRATTLDTPQLSLSKKKTQVMKSFCFYRKPPKNVKEKAKKAQVAPRLFLERQLLNNNACMATTRRTTEYIPANDYSPTRITKSSIEVRFTF